MAPSCREDFSQTLHLSFKASLCSAARTCLLPPLHRSPLGLISHEIKVHFGLPPAARPWAPFAHLCNEEFALHDLWSPFSFNGHSSTACCQCQSRLQPCAPLQMTPQPWAALLRLRHGEEEEELASLQQTMEKHPGREPPRLRGDVSACGAPAALMGFRVEELTTLPGGWEAGGDWASVSPQIPRKGEPLPLRELRRPEGLWTRVPRLFSCSLPAVSGTVLVPRWLKCLTRHPPVHLQGPCLRQTASSTKGGC